MPHTSQKTRTVAHVLPFSSIGGTEQATVRVAQAVSDSGYRSIMFYRSDSPVVQQFFQSHGFETVAYEPVEPSIRRPGPFLRAGKDFASNLHRHHVDLVHCADFSAAYYTAIPARYMAHIAVLCHIRNRFEHVSRRDQLFVSPVTKYAFVSKQTWKQFGVRVSERHGFVIYDGIDASPAASACSDVPDEFRIPTDHKIVGMVARVAPQKDYETLIKAAARVVRIFPHVTFMVVGDHSSVCQVREHYAQVQLWLAQYDVKSNFVFTDFRSDVNRLIAAMDIFTLSTHWEGLPLVLLEAMVAGKPVVATDVDGVPELVSDGVTGRLFGSKDDATLANHLLDLLQNPADIQRLGAAGREHVRTTFSRDNFRRSVVAAYNGLLSV